jgi:hypothetical protein
MRQLCARMCEIDQTHTLRASASTAGPSALPLRLSCPLQNWLARPSIGAEQGLAIREVHGAWR